jgi:hypothetical protein
MHHQSDHEYKLPVYVSNSSEARKLPTHLWDHSKKTSNMLHMIAQNCVSLEQRNKNAHLPT